jgi:D-sedoheptulose 7-phosphate isomerase
VINQHLTSLAVALQAVDAEVPRLQGWATTTVSAFRAGGQLLVCGDGGSAEQAQHLASRLSATDDDRPALARVTLLATGAPAAAGPTPAGDKPAAAQAGGLAGQIRAAGSAGDILLIVSAAGASPELAAGAVTAREQGMTAWALTGPAPNPVAQACDDAVAVPAAAVVTAEEVHLAAIHIFCAAVDSAVRDAARAETPSERPSPAAGGTSRARPWQPQVAS